MTITDDRSASVSPPTPPPSFVRRHPILAGFGVLSGLSLFSALWPVSAIVVSRRHRLQTRPALDRAAWSLTSARLAARAHCIARSPDHESHADPSPPPTAPRREVPHRRRRNRQRRDGTSARRRSGEPRRRRRRVFDPRASPSTAQVGSPGGDACRRPRVVRCGALSRGARGRTEGAATSRPFPGRPSTR